MKMCIKILAYEHHIDKRKNNDVCMPMQKKKSKSLRHPVFPGGHPSKY